MWKRIPPALLAGLAIRIVFDAMRIVHFIHPAIDPAAGWEILENGIDVAASCLIISGALQLLKMGGHRIGVVLVIAAEVAMLAVYGLFVAVTFWLRTHEPSQPLLEVLHYVRYGDSLIMLTSAIGFGLISRSRVIAVGLPVFSAIGIPLPPLAAVFWGDQDPGLSLLFIRLLPYALLALGALIAVAVGVTTLASPVDELAERPFEQAARALWLRVIAAVSLAGVTVLAMSAGIGFLSLFKALTIGAPLVDAIALALFARAALGLARANVSRWPSLAAAAGSLWCVGVMLSRIPHAYALAYPYPRPSGSFVGMFDADETARLASAYATTVPLVATVSIGLVLIAITALARQRNLDDVRENASVRTGAFVVLALGSLFIARYGLQEMALGITSGMFTLAVVGAAGASIYALVIAAKLCDQARAIVSSDPAGLPAATLLKETSR